MGEELVSVVIPAWNAAAYLAEAVRSVLAQEAGPVEVVIVDDGSQDDTAEVAAGFGSAIRVLRQAHAGIGAARNRGVAEARGELLSFLDADDVWPRGRLRAQRAALEADETLDMVFGHAVEFGGGGGEKAPAPALLCGASLMRASSFRRVGPLREDLRVGEFIDWMARAREAGLRYAVLEELCLLRRLHAHNTGRTVADRSDYARVVRAALQRRREPRA